MKDNLPRYTMRINQTLLNKLQYISQYEGRSANKQLEQLVKRCIKEFEAEPEEITEEMLHELYGND